MTDTIHVGDVSVIQGEPPDGNPYRGKSLMGLERAEALRKFMRNIPQAKLTFWYAPCSGGAKRITKDEVNWGSSGVSKGDWEDIGGRKDLMGWNNPEDMVQCRKCQGTSYFDRRRRCKCDELGVSG